MSDRIRFHLDEDVHPGIARALRQHGIDLTTSIEAGLRTCSDHEHWEYARRTRRVLVVHDTGFLRMAAADPVHPGVVYAPKAKRSIRQIIRGLTLVHEVLTPEEMISRVEYL